MVLPSMALCFDALPARSIVSCLVKSKRRSHEAQTREGGVAKWGREHVRIDGLPNQIFDDLYRMNFTSWESYILVIT